MQRYILLLPLIFLLICSEVNAAEIIIEKPDSGFTTSRIIKVKGSVKDYPEKNCIMIANGISQRIPLRNGIFNFRTVPSPGLNTIEIQAQGISKKISFYAKVPPRDIKIVLSWDTDTFTDLWVTDPSGERCYWSRPVTPTGGNLVYDDNTYAPQVYTMASAMPGTYSVQVQYYSSGRGVPVTRFKIDLVLFENTVKEERRHYEYIATKAGHIYQVTEFTIEPR